MAVIRFHVPGAPQGKGRARAFVRNGEVGHYTPEKTRTYEGLIRSHAMDAMGRRCPLDGPVELTLFIVMPIPKTWPKWKSAMARAGSILPTTKPDADNVEKAVKDAMNRVVWGDDCQVVCVVKTKTYVGREYPVPGVYVTAQAIPEFGAQLKRKPEAA